MTLAEYLIAADLTHSAFAEKLGVSQVTVHRWVNGKRFPDRETILRIEEVTGRIVRPADWFHPITPERFDAITSRRASLPTKERAET